MPISRTMRIGLLPIIMAMIGTAGCATTGGSRAKHGLHSPPDAFISNDKAFARAGCPERYARVIPWWQIVNDPTLGKKGRVEIDYVQVIARRPGQPDSVISLNGMNQGGRNWAGLLQRGDEWGQRFPTGTPWAIPDASFQNGVLGLDIDRADAILHPTELCTDFPKNTESIVVVARLRVHGAAMVQVGYDFCGDDIGPACEGGASIWVGATDQWVTVIVGVGSRDTPITTTSGCGYSQTTFSRQ